MPTPSIRLEFSYGYLYWIWFPLGILFSIAITLSAKNGYIPDPLSFLNETLLDLRTEQEDWLSLSIKTGIIAILVLSIIAAIIQSTRITGLYISEDTTIVHRGQQTQKHPTSSIHNLIYTPTSNGDFKARFTLGGSELSFTLGSYQREKLDSILEQAKRDAPLDSDDDTETQELAPSDDSENYQETAPASIDSKLLKLIESPEQAKPSYQKLFVLLLTLFAFMAAGGYRWGLEYTALIVIALFIHELGHVLAMRAFKYKDISILFLPFLGAAARGIPENGSPTKNALVSYAGPACGILTAATASIALVFYPSELLFKFIFVSYFLNGLNLLPFKPLDGGHFLNSVLFSRFPTAQLIFDLVAVAGIGFIAYQTESWIFGAIALFTLFGTPHRFSLAKLTHQIRPDVATKAPRLDIPTVRFMRARLAEALPALTNNADTKLPALAKTIQKLWKDAQMEHPSLAISALLFLLYLASFPAIFFLFGFAQAIANSLMR